MPLHKLIDDAIRLPWIIFIVYWLAASLNINRTKESEPFASRYGVMLILIVGYVMIFTDSLRVGALELRFLPNDLTFALLGIVLTWLGIALALWARLHLGKNWSARVTIKEGHELIRTGPYRRLRNPIYSGLILAVIGTALEVGKGRALVGVALVAIGFSLKALKEESMLSQQFGEKFQEHRKHTGFLLPRFR
jgi:protein-S-isoprenylcysteine O-methyltransferase Ste14